MAPPPVRRPRAARLDPETRRGLIVDAAEHLFAEHDPLLLTFDQVAQAGGVSRALVHSYLGDRRGLIDAVHVSIIGRLETWVGHGFHRATTRPGHFGALVQGTLSFVETERDAWSVLGASGGFDHPTLHGVRERWTIGISLDERRDDVGAHAAIGALLLGAGHWVNRGIEANEIEAVLGPLVGLGATEYQMPKSAERTRATAPSEPA